jgi:DNA primase
MDLDDGFDARMLRGRAQKRERYNRFAVDLLALVTRLIGSPESRAGQNGDRPWWKCPIHLDNNPSFTIDENENLWKCFGCGEYGDAADLVMRVNGCTFVEALAWINGKPGGVSTTARKAPGRRSERSSGKSVAVAKMKAEDAMMIAESSAEQLWSEDRYCASTLTYLYRRGLTDKTIRASRLGYTHPLGTCWGLYGKPSGIVIPWYEAGRLTFLKLRQPDSPEVSKYRELFRDHPTIYPNPEAIRAGKPLLICEGEFDALLLGQELADLASVATLGSSSNRPTEAIVSTTRIASRLILAHDVDDAGDRAAAAWPEGTRVKPPAGKDWTDARRLGINLREFWSGMIER